MSVLLFWSEPFISLRIGNLGPGCEDPDLQAKVAARDLYVDPMEPNLPIKEETFRVDIFKFFLKKKI